MPTNYLCDIEGLCAVYNKPTLNDRPYSKIYKRLLSGQDYRFNEMLKRGGILCELGHPAQETADFERTETDLNKVCAILTDIYEGEDNKVYAKGKVLDTPSGRIYMAMKPFYNFGFSSRGSYDAVDSYQAEGPDGWNQDSYVFKGFDLVALPATEESVISATEGLNDKKSKRKSARESLDLNEIASAANVTPEEIDRELDKLFTEKGDIEGQEFVSMREYNDMQNKDHNEVVNDLAIDKAVADLEAQGIGPDDIPDDLSPARDIKQDLQTALSEASKLREELDRLTFENQNIKSELESIRAEKDSLLSRAIEAEKALKDYEEIKSLSSRLVDSYQGVSDAFDSEKRYLEDQIAKEQQTSTKFQREANQAANEKKLLEEKLTKAEESLQKYKAGYESALKSAQAAKESLINVYAKNYGVAPETLKKKLGVSYKLPQIKMAAEALARDGIRMSSVAAESIQPTKISPTKKREAIEFKDEVERELFEALLPND